MKKILASTVAVAFAGLFVCLALGPVLFSDHPMQAGCMNMDVQGGGSSLCSAHSDLDVAVSTGNVFTLIGLSLAVALLAAIFAPCLSFILSRVRLFPVSGPPSTSFLLHRKTVLIRP